MANKSKYNFVSSDYNESTDEDPLVIDSEIVSNNFNNPLEDEIQYEINSGVQYRLVESTTTTNISPIQPITHQLQVSMKNLINQSCVNTTQNSETDMNFISELQSNRPCVIYPKTTTSPNMDTKKTIITGPNRKRDEARRATHNEVERRRRDRINHWIERLRVLLPEEVSSSEKQHMSRTSNDSKSAILIRACEYIKNMKEELENLKMCLDDIDEVVNLKEENSLLRAENEMLHVQNEKLKEVLSIDDKSNITKLDSPPSSN